METRYYDQAEKVAMEVSSAVSLIMVCGNTAAIARVGGANVLLCHFNSASNLQQ